MHVSAFDPWVEIHAANLRHNAAEIARLAKRPVLAVIKNNGYGLGAVNVAKVLDGHAAIAGFAVVKVQEALNLRAEGIKKPVLLMGPVDEVDLRRVAYVKRLAAGMSAGYERAYVAKKDTWIATLPIGHTDGWPRIAAKGARVRINDRMYPVVASVSASHTIVEIGDADTVRAGDLATLFDWQDGSRPEGVAAASAASVHDLTMHLNPLLPRAVV